MGTVGSREPPSGTQALVCLFTTCSFSKPLSKWGKNCSFPTSVAGYLPFMLGVSWLHGPERKWRRKRRDSDLMKEQWDLNLGFTI